VATSASELLAQIGPADIVGHSKAVPSAEEVVGSQPALLGGYNGPDHCENCDSAQTQILGVLRSMRTIRRKFFFGQSLRASRNLISLFGLQVSVLLTACSSPRPDPVTLTFLDPDWSHDVGARSLLSEASLAEFTSLSGIRINHLPAPETDAARLALTNELLLKGSSGPDVYSIDVVWPGTLAHNLVDLSSYLQAEIQTVDPAVVTNYQVEGALVAMPYRNNAGALYYRADLLRKYGYRHPPRTWDELESMALHIQHEERARGQKDFWGFVWPGAASEALLCNALEWQGAEGGGRIVEQDRTISVDNPATVRSWKRARSWIGHISPPSVLSYQEWDAINAFANSGRAAFFRGWISNYLLIHPRVDTAFRTEGITSVPGITGVRVATLGGSGLAISQSSKHRAEAVQLIRFLLQKDGQPSNQFGEERDRGSRELYELPTLLKTLPTPHKGVEERGADVILRPALLIPDKYAAVSRAYALAVHSVLSGETKASTAAANLQATLIRITGLPPRAVDRKF
jgi:trehalose/maltose transport system substrate-binding protein